MKNCELCIYYDFKDSQCTLTIETKKNLRFFHLGVAPQTPLKALMSNAPSTPSQVTRLDTQPYPLLLPGWLKGRLGQPTANQAQGVACGQPRSQREGGSVWQIFTLEQLKSHSWNIAKETAHPSVGRSLSAGHHRLILPLCRLRLNAPPQDRLHRSNVTMLARAKPNIPHREPLRTIHTVAISLVFPQ